MKNGVKIEVSKKVNLSFRLKKDSDGTLNLMAQGEDSSEEYYVVGISKDGRLFQFAGINDDLGLVVDEEGKIEVYDD